MLALWLSQEKRVSELFFPSVSSHGLERDGSRWLRNALLTTESKTIWIFKAAVLDSGHKHMGSMQCCWRTVVTLGLSQFLLVCEELDLTVVATGKSLKFPGTK